MCGIFGIVFDNENENMGKVLHRAGERLVYRGYDSVGVAVVKDGVIDLRKDAGTIEDISRALNFDEMSGIRGIIQLRWATFGRPSHQNAQPHLDCDGNMVGAHNGNIVNTTQLRERFMEEGHNVRGWNDGEMMVHAVEAHYDDNGGDMKSAMMEADKDIHGDYAYLITTTESNEMFGCKKGSSLYLGVGDDFICCSSDLPSILPLTRNIVRVMDGECLRFDAHNYQIFDIETGMAIEREAEICKLTPNSVEKGGFNHFMMKEIHEQVDKSRSLIDTLQESEFVDDFLGAMNHGPVYLVGSGSSYNACVIGSHYMNKLGGILTIPVMAGDFVDHYGAVLERETPIICVSQSGESKDIINVVNYCRKSGKGRILGVLNVLGSTLMLNSDVYLPLVCDLEMSVPATKTMLNQVILFLFLSLQLAKNKGTLERYSLKRLEDEMHQLPDKIKMTIDMCDGPMNALAQRFVDTNVDDSFVLGYGLCHGTALEGALKIKEVTYSHCEGMYSSEFKHGPLAIVEKGYPVIFLSTPEDTDIILSHINEVSCRKGLVIFIGGESVELRKNSGIFIPIPPSHEFLTPVLGMIPLQMLAYYWAVKRGMDPDRPRNLSKTITVD